MSAHDPALSALSQNWLALAVLHGRIESRIERALPTNDAALREALDDASAEPDLVPLVDAVRRADD